MPQKSDRLSGAILACCAAAAVIVCTTSAYGAMEYGSVPFFLAAVLLFWVPGAALLIRWPLFRDPAHTCCALVGLYLCLCLRLSLFDHISGDYVSFLSPWTETMRNMTVREALATPIGDYNMPYLYLLLLISRLPAYDLYCIKLCSVVADMFAALAVGKLAAMMSRRGEIVLLAFFAALLAPTTFLNSAYWGQCDSIYGAFALWGLYYGLKRRPALSLSLLACAFAFKLQAVFILPILAFLLVQGRMRVRHLPVFPAVFLAIMLPPLLAGRSLADTFGIYGNQTGAYPYLSLNATSFWSMLPNEYFDALDPAPVLLAGIVVVGLLYVFLGRYARLRTGDLLALSLVFTLAIPWLLPRMHERYFYLAELLSIVYAARYPRRLPVAVLVLGGGYLAYCSYLFGGMPILSTAAVAAIFGLTLIYLIVKLLQDTAPGKEVTHD